MSCSGAQIFIELELPKEESYRMSVENRGQDINDRANYIADVIVYLKIKKEGGSKLKKTFFSS